MKIGGGYFLGGLLLLLGLGLLLTTSEQPVEETVLSNTHIDIAREEQEDTGGQQVFLRDGLTTNTAIRSIDLKDILDGGPGKDGIPPIDDPVFLSQQEVQQAMSYLTSEALGIVIVGVQEQRFYPYAIMNRHEIVNDELDGIPIAVTFCPLCGSAIVFDRRVDDTILRMGVSGKLFQSNLLMYDDITESLWSQARGKGVVGQYTDTKLTHIKSDVMSYELFIKNYPQGVVLSDATDHNRDYAQAPYGDYDVNDILFFPVSNTDARLPKKEILYVVNNKSTNQSIAFVKKDLVVVGEVTFVADDETYVAAYKDGVVTVMWPGSTDPLPGYHEMFFSRATHHTDSNFYYLWPQE